MKLLAEGDLPPQAACLLRSLGSRSMALLRVHVVHYPHACGALPLVHQVHY